VFSSKQGCPYRVEGKEPEAAREVNASLRFRGLDIGGSCNEECDGQRSQESSEPSTSSGWTADSTCDNKSDDKTAKVSEIVGGECWQANLSFNIAPAVNGG